jgi:diguanylate cyclase (GGDEF)-like protein
MSLDPNALPSLKKQPLEASWETISRLDWQLWLLAVLVIITLGMGVLSFMFPTVFWAKEGLVLKAPERAFYGLCVLLCLTLAYLLQKQNKLREIKRGIMAERERREKELIHTAFHDALTDLPNRPLLLDRLRLSLARAKRHQEYRFAMIYIDLDRLKVVNESMGHQVGDQVLVEIARRLQRCLRPEDTVARLGGDEFGILLDNMTQMSDISHAVERIQSVLSSPISLAGQDIFANASMGISLSSMGYEEAEDLLRDADTAMHRAKAQGTGQYAVFDASMHEYAVLLLNTESSLRRAMERQEFELHYQPIVWLRTGHVAGLEALVRWRHPDRGLLSPAEFIPIAESAGLILSLTQSLLQQAYLQLQKWHVECPASWPLNVSVNLPAKYLTREDLVESIISAIAEHGLQPHSIRLEITENQLMDNAESIKRALLHLNNSGIRIHIDDFGTGFSSLSYLSTFQVDAIKIDQSFVRNLSGNGKNAAIVRSINSLGHNLAIDVIAEGIETVEQLNYLKAVKCQYGQGYYFARPMEPKTVSGVLAEWFPASREKRMIAPRLLTFELFSELEQPALLEIAQTCEEINIPSGAVIIHQGQVGDFAYLMEEGSVGVYDGEADDSDCFVVLQAPAVFGEMALVNPEGTRTASVKALSNLRLLTVPIIPCLSFLRRFPVLKKNLDRLIAGRERSGH